MIEAVLGWFERRRARRKVPWSACAWNPHEFAKRQREESLREAMRANAAAQLKLWRVQAEAQLAATMREHESQVRRNRETRAALDRMVISERKAKQ